MHACMAHGSHNNETRDVNWKRDNCKNQGCQNIEETMIYSAKSTLGQVLSIRKKN
jgi:hypothetical protein